jgi:ABC-type fe3+-siderophore transport system, permease component
VLASDILGRVLVVPSELEVGIVTAFIGAPVLMLLVMHLSTGSRGAKKSRMGAKAQAHDEAGPAHSPEHGHSPVF